MITYLKGDATLPHGGGEENKFIVHVCNNINKWGAGFTGALNHRWGTDPMSIYLESSQRLGAISIAQVQGRLWVVNMVAQDGVGTDERRINYSALGECLEFAFMLAVDMKASVHMPRIACGLAGGTWAETQEVIEDLQKDYDVNVFVYDLER